MCTILTKRVELAQINQEQESWQIAAANRSRPNNEARRESQATKPNQLSCMPLTIII